MSDSGFDSVIARELAKRKPKESESMLGHTFLGYRRKGFEFRAIFQYDKSEQTHDKFVCEQMEKNSTPGTERHEAATLALKHWPRE